MPIPQYPGDVDPVDAAAWNAVADAVDLNTAKVTNATHTGEVTGATALTVNEGAAATAAATDKILGRDVSDGDALVTFTAQSIADLAAGGSSLIETSDVWKQTLSGSFGYVVSGFHATPGFATVTLHTSLSATARTVFFYPVYLKAGTVISGVTYNIGTASNGDAVGHFGLYSANGTNGLPETRLFTQTSSVTATGSFITALASNYTVPTTGLYFEAVKVAHSTATINPGFLGEPSSATMPLPVIGLQSPGSDLSGSTALVTPMSPSLTVASDTTAGLPATCSALGGTWYAAVATRHPKAYFGLRFTP